MHIRVYLCYFDILLCVLFPKKLTISQIIEAEVLKFAFSLSSIEKTELEHEYTWENILRPSKHWLKLLNSTLCLWKIKITIVERPEESINKVHYLYNENKNCYKRSCVYKICCYRYLLRKDTVQSTVLIKIMCFHFLYGIIEEKKENIWIS